jgi:hypothetical protein
VTVATKSDLVGWLRDALRAMGGHATVIDASRAVWQSHEKHLRESGDLFYTWQYDLRWAAYELRLAGQLKAANQSPRGTWELTARGWRE